jgi:hypothetical protein
MIELSKYVLEALRKDEEFILYRGRSKDEASQVLVLSPVAEYSTPESLKRLEHECSFREELDPRSRSQVGCPADRDGSPLGPSSTRVGGWGLIAVPFAVNQARSSFLNFCL